MQIDAAAVGKLTGEGGGNASGTICRSHAANLRKARVWKVMDDW